MIAICQVAPWDRPIEVLPGEENGGTDFNYVLKPGDKIIVKNEQGMDLVTVVKICPREVHLAENTETKVETPFKNTAILVRRATSIDIDKMNKKNEHRDQSIKDCEQLIKKHNLPMKLIDMVFHYDGGRVTFAFTAASKVDFRELVKDLAKKLHRSIRLYQVGARQEVEMSGDVGPCGRSLCCLNFLDKLGNVTTDLIFDQQIAHRGVDRLSGICGRLKCCLLFEEDNYKELSKNFPPMDSFVKTSKGDGRVVSWKILKQTVMVKIDNDTTVEIDIKDIKSIK